MARYLVTGGAGFIGSHLVEALINDGHVVRVLDDLSSGRTENLPRGVDLVIADVTEQRAVQHALDDVDGCFHLAAIASVDRCRREWRYSHRVNLTGTITVFEEACRAQHSLGRPLPVIYASSAAVYGDASEVPLSEEAVPRPVSAYGVDKLGCELHAAMASRIYKMRSVGLRFFNVYGPRQDPNSPYSGVISIFCRRILQGVPLEIHGNGEQIRDFIYVRDAANALRRAMAAAAATPQVYNVCTGVGTSVCQLAAEIARMRDVSASLQFVPSRAGDLTVSLGDPRQAREKLKFGAATSLQQGLARTIEAMMSRQTRTGTPERFLMTGG